MNNIYALFTVLFFSGTLISGCSKSDEKPNSQPSDSTQSSSAQTNGTDQVQGAPTIQTQTATGTGTRVANHSRPRGNNAVTGAIGQRGRTASHSSTGTATSTVSSTPTGTATTGRTTPIAEITNAPRSAAERRYSSHCGEISAAVPGTVANRRLQQSYLHQTEFFCPTSAVTQAQTEASPSRELHFTNSTCWVWDGSAAVDAGTLPLWVPRSNNEFLVPCRGLGNLGSLFQTNGRVREGSLAGWVMQNVDLTQTSVSPALRRTFQRELFRNRNAASMSLGGAIPGTSFFHTVLDYATFQGVNCVGCTFDTAQIKGGNFVEANLHGVEFSNSSLRDAEFEGANLTAATFRNANLTGANFTRANLEGADLVQANLTQADLRGANLTDILVGQTNFSEAKVNCNQVTGNANLLADLRAGHAELIGDCATAP